MADSCQCMAKPIQYCKVKQSKNKNKIKHYSAINKKSCKKMNSANNYMSLEENSELQTSQHFNSSLLDVSKETT